MTYIYKPRVLEVLGEPFASHHCGAPKPTIRNGRSLISLDVSGYVKTFSLMSTPTLPVLSSPTSQIDANPGQFGAGFNHNMLDGNYFFIAGGVVAGTMAILVGCAVWRMRLVRRRRVALGLPPRAARPSRNEEVNILKNKPVFYDAWTDFGLCIEEEKRCWDQMQVRTYLFA